MRVVHAGAAVQQDAHRRQVTAAHGEQQRREAGLRAALHVRTRADQQADDVSMTFRGRPHQRILTAPSLDRANIGAARQQRLDRRNRARARRTHERRLAFGVRGVGIGACSQQTQDEIGPASRARHGQRRHAISIGRLDIGAGTNEQIGDREVVFPDGPMQRRRAVRLRDVDRGAFLQRRLHERGISRLNRGDESGWRGGGWRAERQEQQHAQTTSASSAVARVWRCSQTFVAGCYVGRSSSRSPSDAGNPSLEALGSDTHTGSRGQDSASGRRTGGAAARCGCGGLAARRSPRFPSSGTRRRWCGPAGRLAKTSRSDRT